MPPPLDLKGASPVASGSQRKIYRHPTDSTKVVKVLRDVPKTTGRTKLAVWTERQIPAFRNMWVRREYMEYLRFALRSRGTDLHAPIAHLYGFVMTSAGLGCLSDAVVDGDILGETLYRKVKDGRLSPADLALFNDTVARIYTYDIRAGDMTARNFVFGYRDLGGGPGPRECVLVDGFGDIHAIRYRSWARRLNALGLNDSCQRLASRTGLVWQPQIRQFRVNN